MISFRISHLKLNAIHATVRPGCPKPDGYPIGAFLDDSQPGYTFANPLKATESRNDLTPQLSILVRTCTQGLYHARFHELKIASFFHEKQTRACRIASRAGTYSDRRTIKGPSAVQTHSILVHERCRVPCHRLETRRREATRPQTRSQLSKFVQSSVGTSKCWRSRGGVVRFSLFSPAVHSYLRHCKLSCHLQAGYAPRRGIETTFNGSSTQSPQQASLCETFPGATLGREPRTVSAKSGCAKITQIGGKW
ncbi:hypothetical protein EV401DRAFT_1262862 [Pisolithus croceorrhizus]|nr:hypothetical protein EV401DRAFT_1262862 [Pisolithus croceorrhizus]